MSKTISYDNFFGHHDLELEMYTYMTTGNMYIGLIEREEDGYPEHYDDLTKNLDEELPPYHAYVDTNNLPGAGEMIMKAGLGEPTGKYSVSGFCTYPLYRFHKEKLQEYCPEGVAIYEAALQAPAKRRTR